MPRTDYEEKDPRPYEGATVQAINGAVCGRASARNQFAQIVEALRRRADQYQALLDALPAKLPPEADEALWSLACKAWQSPL